MTKPKARAKPAPKPRWRDRAVTVTKAHPWLTWGGVASIAAVISVAVSGVMWIGEHFQTVAAAEVHAQKDAKDHVETLYGQQNILTTIMRNAVNACDEKVGKSDRKTCQEYRMEYREASQRNQALYLKTLENAK